MQYIISMLLNTRVLFFLPSFSYHDGTLTEVVLLVPIKSETMSNWRTDLFLTFIIYKIPKNVRRNLLTNKIMVRWN